MKKNYKKLEKVQESKFWKNGQNSISILRNSGSFIYLVSVLIFFFFFFFFYLFGNKSW